MYDVGCDAAPRVLLPAATCCLLLFPSTNSCPLQPNAECGMPIAECWVLTAVCFCMPNLFYESVLFLAGLVFGSFLNVCITRIPRDESVIRPSSHCRGCGKPIRWFDNIPLLSYALLRGRCRSCGTRIPLRYPTVELLTGLLFAACFAWYGPTWLTLKLCIFCFLVTGLIFTDAETGLLVHEFTYPGIVLGLALAWIAPWDYSATQFLLLVFDKHIASIRWLSLLDSTIAALAGAGFFFLAWALYYLVRKRHGLGFGDIALMAMTGAFLGLKLTAFVIACAPIVTVFWALVLLVWEALRPSRSAPTAVAVNGKRRSGKKDSPSKEQPFLQREIPFGVFLGICSLAAIFLGEAAWKWYLGRF